MTPAYISLRGLAVGALTGCWCVAATAADVNPVGVWRVVSYTATDPQTKETTQPFGERPTGTAIYTGKGHMSVLVTGRDRVSPAATGQERDAERARLLDSMYANEGEFSVKGDTVTIHIKSAWQPSWVGTDRVRTLELDKDSLVITTPPMQSPVDGRTYISVTRFRRVE